MVRSIVLFVFAGAAFAQSAGTALTQALITGIRALRRQLEATVQIALYRLQRSPRLSPPPQKKAAHARYACAAQSTKDYRMA